MLKVWLPLDGDLTQQGTANTTFSGTPAWKTYGKIGSAALNLQNRITCTTTALNGVQFFSVTFWARIENNPDSTANWMDVIGFTDQTSSGTNGQFRFETGYGNSAYSGVHWHDNATNAIINGSYTYNTGTEFDKWHHIAVTVSDTEVCSYYDGILKSTITANLNKGHLTGAWWLGESTTRGCIQDVRIYDHCLSAAEVKEISQGLVLHYKLDDPNPNLLLSTPKSYTPNSYCGYQLNFTENLVSGQTYTLQLWDVLVEHSAKTAAEMNLCAYWGGGSVILKNFNGTSNFEILRDHYAYSSYLVATFTISSSQASGTGATNAWFNMYNSVGWVTGTVNMHIGAWKLEKGNIATPWTPNNTAEITDSSGYSRNGTITGTFTLSPNTARYSSTLYFGAYQTPLITNNNPSFLAALTNCSVSWWEYITVTSNSLPFVGQSGSYYIGAGTTSTKLYHCNVGSSAKLYRNGVIEASQSFNSSNQALTSGTFTHTQNQWVHFVLSGANLSTWTAFKINGYGTGWPINGYISDVRIYCTALSADDILSLYHTGAKVDNKGGIHTYELNEEIGIEENAKFINSSATSMTYDAATDTYTIVSPVGTSSWGYGVRLADTPALMVPYGATYRWTAEIWTPVALNVNTDYNNTAGSADVNWAGNDNDATGTRLAASNAIPANAWTRIYRGASNTHTSNTNHLSIRDYSSLGLVTNGQSGPVTWKIRHLQWYLVDTTFKPQVKKTGIINAEHFTEVEQNLNKPAQFNKQMFSVNGNEFIEL